MKNPKAVSGGGCAVIVMIGANLVLVGVALAMAAEQAQAPGPKPGLSAWLLTGPGAILAWMIRPYLGPKLVAAIQAAPGAILDHLWARWQKRLQAGEIDPPTARLARALWICLARWAQEEIPAEKMGPQRMAFLLAHGKALPYVGFLVGMFEGEIRKGIEGVLADVDRLIAISAAKSIDTIPVLKLEGPTKFQDNPGTGPTPGKEE